ncbi:hypothetical protein [Fodinicurvata sp. EGI_FJ10296]|uniref:hypothetical protein n=1 Tax=Fodinicurvata sp. EGI_FJ10296 TaxID=3231908 RepID=UPI003452CA5D
MTSTYSVVRDGVAFINFKDEGRFEISGSDATAFMNGLVSKDLEALEELRTVQTLFLNDAGEVISIAWVMVDRDRLVILTEPADRDLLRDHLQAKLAEAGGLDVTVSDLGETMQSLALMGPSAQKLATDAVHEDIIGLSFLSFDQYDEIDALVMRVGYVGEYEYRILVPQGDETVEKKIREAGAEIGLEEIDPAGLAPLMLEMRQITRSRDLNGVSPIEAGLHEMIDFKKEEFIGRDAVLAMKDNIERRLMTVVIPGPKIAAFDPEVRIDDDVVGRVVSHDYSEGMESMLVHCVVNSDVAAVGVTYDLYDGSGALVAGTAQSAPLLLTKTIKGVT